MTNNNFDLNVFSPICPPQRLFLLDRDVPALRAPLDGGGGLLDFVVAAPGGHHLAEADPPAHQEAGQDAGEGALKREEPV